MTRLLNDEHAMKDLLLRNPISVSQSITGRFKNTNIFTKKIYFKISFGGELMCESSFSIHREDNEGSNFSEVNLVAEISY